MVLPHKQSPAFFPLIIISTSIRNEERLSQPHELLLSFFFSVTSKIRRLPPSTRILTFFPKQTYPSLPHSPKLLFRPRKVFTRSWGSIISQMATVGDGRLYYQTCSTSPAKASFDHDKPVQDISMYLTSLPFQHEDLPSFDWVKLNKQGVALWNICTNVRQTGQLPAQKELISEGSAHRPKREPY